MGVEKAFMTRETESAPILVANIIHYGVLKYLNLRLADTLILKEVSKARNKNMNRFESEISKYENSYRSNPIKQYTSYMFNEVLKYFQNE